MDRPLVALVLAGGTGTRLYPASRADRPKQFLALGEDDRSLLARTVDRAGFADRVVVSTAPEYADRVPAHAPDAEVLVEPAAKDTGPAVLYAAHRLRERLGDPVVLALPSDHHVGDDEAFGRTLRTAARVAADRELPVAVGVDPTRPEPGYGYVEPGTDRGDHFDLAAFHEKPDRATAADYLAAGYRWNAGIYAFTPDALLAAARGTRLGPLVEALAAGEPERGFERAPAVSIDSAVMEHVERAALVPGSFPWDDLGAWDALERVVPADGDGNVTLADTHAVDADGNVVASDGAHVSLVDVEDLVVVAWDDRVLVVPKARAQRVRELVAELRASGRF